MIRLLVLVLLAYLVWRGIESLLDQVRLSPPRRAEPPAGPQIVETLVRCAGCGTHLPRSRTLTAAGGVFF
jgi:hypothetical protein